MLKHRYRFILRFPLAVLLSLLHVCMSAYTPSVASNPLDLLMLFTCEAWSEFATYYIGGMVIQSIVTAIIALFVLNWKRIKIWLVCFAVCLLLQIHFCDFFISYQSQILDFQCIYELENRIGMMHYVNNVIFFSIAQILFLASYLILLNLSIIFKKKKKQQEL